MEIPTINFLLKQFTFLKPSLFMNTLPSCLDISQFHKNAMEQMDATLPYAAYGGIISFDRNVDFNIKTQDYYLCIYVNEGRVQFESDSHGSIGEQKLVFIGYKNNTYNLKTISRISSMYVYFVSGATADSYIKSLSSRPDSKYYFHKEFDMHDFIVNSLSKLNELIVAGSTLTTRPEDTSSTLEPMDVTVTDFVTLTAPHVIASVWLPDVIGRHAHTCIV